MPGRYKILVFLILMIGIGASLPFNKVAGDVVKGGSGVSQKPKREVQDAPAWVRSFPLWMQVPTSAFAVLDEGVARKTRWGIYVYRGNGPKGAEGPSCIQLGTLYYGEPATHRGASFSSVADCGLLAAEARVPTVVASLSIRNRADRPYTVIGMIIAPNVRRVTVELVSGSARTVSTRQLSQFQARKAHTQRLRYLVMRLPRRAVIVGVTGYNASGDLVLSGLV